MLVEAAGFKAAHILRQPENAVAVGAGEIGFRHQFGATCGVGLRQAGGDEGVRDQRAGGARRDTLQVGPVIHRRYAVAWARFLFRIAAAWPPRILSRSAAEMLAALTCRTHSPVPMS